MPVVFSLLYLVLERQKINILGIGRDKIQSQYFNVGNTKLEYETEEAHQGATPPGRVGGPTPCLGGCSRPGGPLPRLFAYKKPLMPKP